MSNWVNLSENKVRLCCTRKNCPVVELTETELRITDDDDRTIIINYAYAGAIGRIIHHHIEVGQCVERRFEFHDDDDDNFINISRDDAVEVLKYIQENIPEYII